MVTGTIGRRIRLGLIGGGPGSIIGETHRIAARLDGQYDIVAAALSSNPERARQAALDLASARNARMRRGNRCSKQKRRAPIASTPSR